MTSLTDIFVTVKPDMQSFGADAKKALGSAAGLFRAAGKDAGKVYTDALAAASKAKIEDLGKKAAAAGSVQADALGKLRVAEAKLTEVRGNSKAKASQLATAEESVAAALRKSTVASGEAKTAASALTREQNKAKKAAEDAAKPAKGGLLGGLTQAFKSPGFKPDASALNKIDGTREGKALATRFGLGFNGAFGGIVSKSAALLAASFATIGIGSLVKDSVNLEASFSQTMNTMAAVAKVPAADMKGLSDLAIKMGADTTFSAAEAGTAMLELAKGGLSAATIRSGGLQGTLTLAAAGGLSLASASTIASNALNTFGLKGKDMASIADALAGGANASSASVESLGIALGQVGPGATTAGLSLQQTVATLAAFDNAGIKGSDAGTSLKTMLTRLVPSTDKAKGAMEDLGLKFTDATGAFVPITNVAQQLKDKLGPLSAAQKSTALNIIFGSDATRAATVLMKEGAAGIGKYIKATSDNGAAQKVAAARMSGTAGALEQFRGSVETAKLQLGQFLAPAIQGGLAKLTSFVNGLVPAIKAVASILATGNFTTAFANAFHVHEDSRLVDFLLTIRSAVVTLAGVVTVTVLPAMANLVGAFTPLAIGIGKTALGLVQTFAVALAGIATVIASTVGPGLLSFTGFLKDNGTAVGIVVGLIALVFIPHFVALGVAALASAAQQKLAWLITKTESAAAAVAHSGAVVKMVAGWVVLSTAAIVNAARIAAAWIVAGGPIVWIIAGIVAVVAAIVILWKKNDGFRNALITAWDAIKGAVGAAIGALVTAFNAVKGAMVTAFDAVKGAIGTAIGAIVTAFDAVKGAVSTAVGFVASVWSTVIGAISGPATVIVNVLQGIWSRIYPILVLPFYIAKAIIGTVFGLILAGFTAAINWVAGAFSSAWAAVAGVLSGPINIAAFWIQYAWNVVVAAFNFAKDWVINTFSKAWGLVSGVISKPLNDAKNWLDKKWAEVRQAFNFAKDWVLNAFGNAWAGITAKLTGPIDTAKNAISTALSGAKGGLRWVFTEAVSAVGKIWDGLQNLAKAPIKFIIQTVLNDGLISGFNWIANTFKAPTIDPIPLPPGFERGGRIPGQPSAKDNLVARGPHGPVGLATGEYVVNARQTARHLPLLEAINQGVSGFAGGGLFGKLKDSVTSAFASGKNLAGDVMNVLSDPVKWFKDRLAGPLRRMSDLGDSRFAETVKAVPRSIVNTVANKAKELLGFGGAGAGGGGNGGSGVARWRSTALAALAAAGGSAGWIDSLLRRMNQESGGNPNAINRWDSNAAIGQPSQGLMQTIPATFSAYAGPYRSRGILDPFANIYAAIKYTMDRYGSGPAGWDRSGGYSQGGKVGSLLFDGGRGYLPTGATLVQNNTGKPEPLTRTDQALDLSDSTVRALGKVFGAALSQGRFRLINSGGGSYVLRASNG